MRDEKERVLLYKCLICSQIFKCFYEGIYKCDGCLRDLKDCPKSFPLILKDISSGLCPACLEAKKQKWVWFGCKKKPPKESTSEWLKKHIHSHRVNGKEI